MIYIPFLNCFLLYICLEEKQILNKPYMWYLNNIAPRLPQFLIKITGGCLLCTSFWIGVKEMLIFVSMYGFDWSDLLILPYNAVVTTILYKLLK